MMPLKGLSFEEIIKKEIKEGKSQEQAVAIAYSETGKNKKNVQNLYAYLKRAIEDKDGSKSQLRNEVVQAYNKEQITEEQYRELVDMIGSQQNSLPNMKNWMSNKIARGTERYSSKKNEDEASKDAHEDQEAELLMKKQNDKDDQDFFTDEQIGRAVRGDVFTHKGKKYKAIQRDEYPIGTPGVWAKEVKKENGTPVDVSRPYEEGAWWYIDVKMTGGSETKKKFSSEQEAKAWLKSEGLKD